MLSGGAEIHYTADGSGPAVLLVQGVGAIGRAWRPQIDALKASYTVIAFDNRGIGESTGGDGPLSIEAMAADALAVADASGASSFHLVGHSMGGIIAQQIAFAAPDRVRSLSLLCTFARGAQGATSEFIGNGVRDCGSTWQTERPLTPMNGKIPQRGRDIFPNTMLRTSARRP